MTRITAIFILLTLLLFQCIFCNEAKSILPAGTKIINQGIIEYKDAGGNNYSSTTPLVIISIRQIYSATIEGDRSLLGRADREVGFYHQLKNTGNGLDLYCVTVANNENDNGDFSDIKVINDFNNNGAFDSDEPVIASLSLENNNNLNLNADQVANLLVIARIPSNASRQKIVLKK